MPGICGIEIDPASPGSRIQPDPLWQVHVDAGQLPALPSYHYKAEAFGFDRPSHFQGTFNELAFCESICPRTETPTQDMDIDDLSPVAPSSWEPLIRPLTCVLLRYLSYQKDI